MYPKTMMGTLFVIVIGSMLIRGAPAFYYLFVLPGFGLALLLKPKPKQNRPKVRRPDTGQPSGRYRP
jgi:hypothetical protein